MAEIYKSGCPECSGDCQRKEFDIGLFFCLECGRTWPRHTLQTIPIATKDTKNELCQLDVFLLKYNTAMKTDYKSYDAPTWVINMFIQWKQKHSDMTVIEFVEQLRIERIMNKLSVYDKIQNACYHLNHDALVYQTQQSKKFKQFQPCAKAIYLLEALRDNKHFGTAITTAILIQCGCHPALTYNQLLDMCFNESAKLKHWGVTK